jgi:hypothetical protein
MADASAAAGQTLYDSPLGSAAVINRVVEAGNDFAYRRRLGDGTSGNPWTIPTDIIKVKNLHSGLIAGAVLQLGEPVIDELDPRHIWIEGDFPSDSSAPFCILKYPTPVNAIAEAFIGGACLAFVNVGDLTHRFAYMSTGGLALVTAHAGPVRLATVPTELSTQILPVIVGQPACNTRLAVITSATLEQGGTATAAEIHYSAFGSTTQIYTGRTFTVFDYFLNLDGALSMDTKVKIEWIVDRWVVTNWYCNPSNTLPEEEE